jgi:FO synthase
MNIGQAFAARARSPGDTGGFTEFVPLPFGHMEAPIYIKGRSRKGPTFRETVLMHAVGRLALHALVSNVQTSWVKLGEARIRACLQAGVNDLGGTLMDETISRSAGAQHGHEMAPLEMESMIRRMDRVPRQRTTLYRDVEGDQYRASLNAAELKPTATGAGTSDLGPRVSGIRDFAAAAAH